MAGTTNELSLKLRDMRNHYIVIFAVEGAAIGGLFYFVLRHVVRQYFDIASMIPQFPYVGVVANLVGIGILLPVVVFATISVIKSLQLDKA